MCDDYVDGEVLGDGMVKRDELRVMILVQR